MFWINTVIENTQLSEENTGSLITLVQYDGWHVCDVSNSNDKQYPAHLEPRQGFRSTLQPR